MMIIQLICFLFVDQLSFALISLKVVEFEPIPFDDGAMPPNNANIELSNDEQYLYDMAVAVSTGVCPESLANRKAGPIHHARWLTKASRILRKYVSTEKPSKDLKELAKYIIKVYVPTFFQIKYQKSCTKGSINFFHLVKSSRYLEKNLYEVVKQVCKDNAYFAHSENLLLAMIYDDNPEVRRMGYHKILCARDASEVNYGEVRDYHAPSINFNCEKYYDLIDWELDYTEPPFTRMRTYLTRFKCFMITLGLSTII